MFNVYKFFIIISFGAALLVDRNVFCSTLCKNKNKKCSYSLSRHNENEYLMVKNIMNNLIKNHWNITLDYLNIYLETQSRVCDQYFDYVAISQVKEKDYRHPNSLFKNIASDKINVTIKEQYEKEWFEKFKLIRTDLQSTRYLTQCNNIGLKIFFLMYDYSKEQAKIFKCSSKLHQEEPVTYLIDYYISLTFLKSCHGNLELLANSIYRLLKYDCERANKFKIAYFNSRYLNMFRVCDPDLNVNDLVNSGKFDNCTQTHHLNGYINKKYCPWLEVVCKYPYTCLRSMNWID